MPTRSMRQPCGMKNPNRITSDSSPTKIRDGQAVGGLMRILISGASIAGPVLAYWLARGGFDVTVVERAPTLRKTGGHAVDLFRPAMEISAQMGVLPHIEALATGTDRLTFYREGRAKATEIDLTKIYAASSDRHVEIMRDNLSEIYYDAARDDVEYL